MSGVVRKKKTFQIKARGNSMFPLLQDGDTIEYVQTPFSQIKLNDIVLEYVNDVLVTHRVIYKSKDTCITRGDNNQRADAPIKKGRVLARVVRFKRRNVWHGIQDVYLMQSALYLNEIHKLETMLNLKNIPHVFLKGVLISLRYEGSIPKRIYADCDILVSRLDTQKIMESFKLLGYDLQERATPRPELVPRSLGGVGRSRPRLTDKPEVSYMKMVNGIPVVFDVHFEPVFLMTQLGGMNLLYTSKQRDDLGNRIISQGERKKIKGFTYSMCSPEDQILYLALHIFHHNYTDSVRYQLLDAVIRKSQLSLRGAVATRQSQRGRLLRHSIPRNDMWSELRDTITQYKLEGYVYLVLILLKKYFKTPIPNSFFKSILPSRFKFQVSSYLLKHVDIFSQDSRTKAGIMRFILIFLLSPNPWWEKMLIFIHPQTISNILGITYSTIASITRKPTHSTFF